MHRLMRAAPTVVSAFGVDALLPLLFHLIRRRIVDVGLALSEQLLTELQDDGEMVAGVGELVWTDLKHGDIFQNHLRKIVKRKNVLLMCFKVNSICSSVLISTFSKSSFSFSGLVSSKRIMS